MRQRLRKFIFLGLWIFAALFVFRFIYGYTKTINNEPSQSQFFERLNNVKRNYASKSYKASSSSAAQSPIKVDQKYEKVAEIKTKSNHFAEEEQVARKQIQDLEALIQFEQKSGNKGYRKLHLLVGVPPENFDALYQRLTNIGNVQAKQITKKDKTNEYKELNAKKASLEKIRGSLIDLKSKGGKIDEYMQLENRILEIEQQLQGLGVSLGDFDHENEFCTVRFSLLEGKEVKISLYQRIKVALEWTIKYYLMLMVSLFCLSICAYLITLILDKLKVFEHLSH